MKIWNVMSRIAMGKRVLFVLLSVLFFACGNGEQDSDDLSHAIYMLGERKKSEQRIIKEQLLIKSQLEANISEVNSEGMRDKIFRDIQIVDLSIEKAKTNIANQDTLIIQLNRSWILFN